MDYRSNPAFQKLRPSDQFLYSCLEDNTLKLRATLLNQGLDRALRAELFHSIKECRETQNRLLTSQVNEIETTQVEIRSFRIKGSR